MSGKIGSSGKSSDSNQEQASPYVFKKQPTKKGERKNFNPAPEDLHAIDEEELYLDESGHDHESEGGQWMLKAATEEAKEKEEA